MDWYFLIFAMFLKWKNADVQIEPKCAANPMVLSNMSPIFFSETDRWSNSFSTEGKCKKSRIFAKLEMN